MEMKANFAVAGDREDGDLFLSQSRLTHPTINPRP